MLQLVQWDLGKGRESTKHCLCSINLPRKLGGAAGWTGDALGACLMTSRIVKAVGS